MHTNDPSQKANLPAMTTGESDAGASMPRRYGKALPCRHGNGKGRRHNDRRRYSVGCNFLF